MLTICPAPGNFKVQSIKGNEGIVLVADIQPHPKNWRIEADFETGTKYQDIEYNTIVDIIKEYSYPVEHIYFTTYVDYFNMPYPSTFVPMFFLQGCDYYSKYFVDINSVTDTNRCFAPMSRLRENRLLLSSWLSYNKDTISFEYTQGWNTSDSDYQKLKELTRCTNFNYLNSFLPKKFFGENPRNDGLDIDAWQNVLSQFYMNSTVSIITETIFWEKAVCLTEKYIMALYGFCFPIFCGGYGVADTLTRLGFDVFNDVIDHSYQYDLHPGNRTLQALELNKDILRSSKIKKKDYIKRHMNNYNLIREDLHIFANQFNIKKHKDIIKYSNDIQGDFLSKVSI